MMEPILSVTVLLAPAKASTTAAVTVTPTLKSVTSVLTSSTGCVSKIAVKEEISYSSISEINQREIKKQ